MSAPLETEQQAHELPAVRAVYEAFDADPGAGKMAPHNFLMLINACEAAGVDLGSPASYDRTVLAGLARWEPTTCAVIAGLITRAHEAGQAGAWVRLTPEQAVTAGRALADAKTFRERQAAEWCTDCETSPTGACEDHVDDLDAAQAYHDLAAELGLAGGDEDQGGEPGPKRPDELDGSCPVAWPAENDDETELVCHWDAGHDGNHYDAIEGREWYLDGRGVVRVAGEEEQ